MTTAPTPTGRPGGPWAPRAAPVLALAALLVAAGVLASPGLRHQAYVSTHRLATPYVELAFASPTAARTCSRDVNAQGVQVALTSHLDRTTAFDWTSGTEHGSLSVAPGTRGIFGVRLPRGTAPRTITITLTGRPERLVLHCHGAGAGAGT